jgi:hypothetical protein
METPMDTLNSVRDAIERRRTLTFTYQGLRREVEPLVVGLCWNGRQELRALQTRGGSVSGTVGDGTPKLFQLAMMRNVLVTDTRFAAPADYKRGDLAFSRIYTQL